MPNTPSAANDRPALAVALALIAGLWAAAAAHTAGEPQGPPFAAGQPLYRVPVNTAHAPTLQLLPQVGPSRAQAIIAARRTAPFVRPAGLKRVHGIGEIVAGRIAPHVRFERPSPARQGVQ
jgi:DNA uptake protein ComE-like DNA-binding protein